MPALTRLALPAALIIAALLIPTPVATETEQCTITVNLPELPAPIVNLMLDPDAPVVNITVESPAFPMLEPTTVVVQPAPILPAEVIYQDRTVEIERILEVPSCLDYSNLPHFDLANALSRAFPGAQWGLSGSHYPGLDWTDPIIPKPDMTAIIGGWLAYLAEDC